MRLETGVQRAESLGRIWSACIVLREGAEPRSKESRRQSAWRLPGVSGCEEEVPVTVGIITHQACICQEPHLLQGHVLEALEGVLKWCPEGRTHIRAVMAFLLLLKQGLKHPRLGLNTI